MLSCLRQILYNFDIDGIKELMTADSWSTTVQLNLMASCYGLHYHFNLFDPDKRGHYLFGVLYFNLITLSITSSTYGLSLENAWDEKGWLLPLFLIF
mmetsp:Transcript_26241/g.40049  ORF Transcript_26241/g.40049 Transcript_26241/m.40049 type:complete len:97 (-) Transcript_26241:2218-2508(-)